MTVAVAFALIGGVILIGFLANLLFRLTRISSVLLLIAIEVLLGPVTGWVTSGSLIVIAPFFGTIALLIILFEGGLELDILTVLQQAPRALFVDWRERQKLAAGSVEADMMISKQSLMPAAPLKRTKARGIVGTCFSPSRISLVIVLD